LALGFLGKIVELDRVAQSTAQEEEANPEISLTQAWAVPALSERLKVPGLLIVSDNIRGRRRAAQPESAGRLPRITIKI
jgi:hypothetical protein